jgi:hypothetical protein
MGKKIAHTPEPWETTSDGTDWGLCGENGGENIAELMTEENAARIVACVNACAGLNPEGIKVALESLEWLANGNADGLHSAREQARHALRALKDGA